VFRDGEQFTQDKLTDNCASLPLVRIRLLKTVLKHFTTRWEPGKDRIGMEEVSASSLVQVGELGFNAQIPF